MSKPTPPARWYAPWRARSADRDDPADYGTAFGLDLSMQRVAELDRMAAIAPSAQRSWVPRWAARRRDLA